jgi:hypothetical protein
MNHTTWIRILIIALCLSACRAAPDLVELAGPDAPAAEAPRAVDQTQPAEDVVAGETDRALGVADGEYGALSSYRLYALLTEQESGAVVEHNVEVVLDPFASHTVIDGDGEMMEMIMVNAGLWMNMPGVGWYKTDFTPEELAMTPAEWLAGEELDALPDIPPWPSEIVFLPGQIPLPLVEGSLTPDGRETVNGIPCRNYAVVTDYRYEFDQAALQAEGATAVQAAGVVWVADQADLPPFIVQADIEKIETTLFAGQEMVSTTRIEYQVTAVNVPIVIEPPAGALSLDQLFADSEEAEPGARATVDDLSDLTSYRLVTSILVQMDDLEMTTTHTVEWVRDAQAYRRTQTDDVSGMSVGFLWIGERAWMLAGNEWMEIQSEEDPDPLDELVGLLEWDEEMKLVGEEVVDGVRCRRYVGDEIVFPHATGQQEVCVADQPGIPPLIIHSRMRMVQEGQTTITEHTLYDINQPMTIEPPG